MKRTPAYISIPVIWLSGTVTLWLSTDVARGWLLPNRMALIYVSAVACCIICAFLQGYFFKPNRTAAVTAVAWSLAGFTFLLWSADLARIFNDGSIGDRRYGSFGFGPDLLRELHPHVFMFFLLVIPSIAVLAARQGAAYWSDRNPLRLHWVIALVLILSSIPLVGEHLFGVNW